MSKIDLLENDPVVGTDVSTKSMSETHSRPRLSYVRTVFEGLLFFLPLLLAIEVLLSVNHIGEQEYLKIDPNLGFTHLENKLVTDRTEAFAINHINSHGLIGSEHEFARAADTTRVAVLGDSIVEAIQVPIQLRFTTLLEHQLEARYNRKFEVMNFGTGGFSTGQEYLQFVQSVRAYKPDVVLLVLHQGDEEENGPAGSKWSLRPTFSLNPDGSTAVRWQEFDTWRHSRSADPLSFFDWGRRHSHIWQALLQVYDSVKNDSLFKRIYNALASANDRVLVWTQSLSPERRQKLIEHKLQDLSVLDGERQSLCREGFLTEDKGLSPSSYDKMQQWKLELRLLELFNEKCFSDHCKFVVAPFYAVEQPKASQDIFAQHLLTVKAQARQSGFQVVDLTPSIENAPDQKTRPIFLLAHLSPRGHEIVSKALSDSIKW
jgi:hypothetical protein